MARDPTIPRDDDEHAAELLDLGDAFFELDRDWRVVRVNRRQEQLSRKPRAATLGRRFGEVWPELATPGSLCEREYRRCMEERVPVQFEEYVAPLDVWMGVTAYPVSGGGIAVFCRDVTNAKRVEEELRRSEERFRLLANAMPQIVCVLGPDGAPEYVNPEWTAFSGLDLAGTRRAGWPGIVHSDDVPAALECRRRTLKALAPQDVELRYRAADGSFRWFLSRLAPVVEGARVIRLVGAAMEIETRKRAEERLRQSEHRLRALLEDVAVGIVEVDEDDRFVAVNGTFCRMLGYREPAELLGRSLHDLTAPEDRELTRALNARGHAGDLSAFEYEKRYLMADGSRLWVHVNVSVVRDGAGRFVRAVATVEDISIRKIAEQEARSLAQFPTENPNPVLRATVDGRVVYANGPARACLQTMGWSDGDRLPEPLLAELRRVPERGTIAAHELATPDGRVWSFTLSASTGEGHVNGFGLEITDRKRYEDELRRANERLRDADRRKDEFLGMLSHELRNPLAPIRSALYVLDHAEPAGQQARRAREVANRQVTHLTRLVDDLLDVTRIARGKVELRSAELDLAALARRTAEDHRGLVQERHLDLALDLPAEPVRVWGDETRLAEVIGNLLQNAAKFTPAGGRVTLAVVRAGGAAELHVRDTGPGIAADVLPTLFEPFTQGKQTLARSEGGLGLGLALVKGLVALHGGSVAVSPAGPHGGSDFVVTLPLADPSAVAAADATTPGPTTARRRRVLVVDDNRDAAESLAELVELLGHDADVAYDGPEALAKVAAAPPDVVLCDIGLPGMDGYEVARRLRALPWGRACRLFAVSGYAQPEDVARAAEAGFDAHVAKPPDPEKLAALLR